jgi:hypothetical protein
MSILTAGQEHWEQRRAAQRADACNRDQKTSFSCSMT